MLCFESSGRRRERRGRRPGAEEKRPEGRRAGSRWRTTYSQGRGTTCSGRAAGLTSLNAPIVDIYLPAVALTWPHLVALHAPLRACRLQAHAGPTNERLTCHLTFTGLGAVFTVGDAEPREVSPPHRLCVREYELGGA